MINWSRIDELKAEVGEDCFDEIVQIFMEEVDEAVALLSPDMPVKDACASLHFLKGGALNLGFSDFSKLCQVGELKASKGELPDLIEVAESYRLSRAVFLEGLERMKPT